ncbi:MAG: hypothetical protein WC915_05365 [archaeon]
MQKLDRAYRPTRNMVRFSHTETPEHYLQKCRVCYQLSKMNLEFVCEARFYEGTRADIYVLDKDTAIEILHTEKDENLEKKRKEYPCWVAGIRTNEEVTFECVEKLVN